jgi:hypothetical protein
MFVPFRLFLARGIEKRGAGKRPEQKGKEKAALTSHPATWTFLFWQEPEKSTSKKFYSFSPQSGPHGWSNQRAPRVGAAHHEAAVSH